MGQRWSKRNEDEIDDKMLKEIEIHETKIRCFDQVFSQSIEPLRQLVSYYNAVVESIERLKEASAMVQGGNILTLRKKKRRIVMVMLKYQDGKECLVGKEEMKMKLEQLKSFSSAKRRLEKLNDVLMKANPYDMTEWEFTSFGRLKIVKKGSQMKSILAFDRAFLHCRNQLLQQVQHVDVQGAVLVLQKAGCCPKIQFKATYPEITIPQEIEFSSMYAILIQCLKDFEIACQEATEAIPELKMTIEAIESEASDFCRQVPDECSRANMSPTETMGIMKKTKANLETISSDHLSEISSSLNTLIRSTTVQLGDNNSAAIGA